MRSILVPLEDGASSHAQLATAVLAADPFHSHLVGVGPRSVSEVYFYAEGLSPVALHQWELDEQARVERAQEAFRDFMRERDVEWGDPLKPSDKLTADWIEEVARGDEGIGQLARLHDMTVLPRPVSNVSTGHHLLLETVLFESGRPILVAPAEAPASIGKVVVIAWNGSTESARSLVYAQPFLQRADRMHVLAVEGGMVAGPEAADVERALRRAGIAAETVVAHLEGRSIGEAILDESAKLGADLLVKGAYTHSRLRQMIFGGATSHILNEATIPVLMAH